MRTLKFNQNINEIKSNEFIAIRSTLLVTKYYLGTLHIVRKKNSISELLKKYSYLIQKGEITIKANLGKHTTLYQSHSKEKLDLTRCHFRCDPMIWHHWKRLANLYGVSMCLLFILCLKEMKSNHSESVGSATDSGWFHNAIFVEFTNFSRKYSHRWFFSRKICCDRGKID